MGSQKMRALRKRMADRRKSWNVHVEGMVFPFGTKDAAEEYAEAILADHPEFVYTIEHEDLTGSPVMEMGE